MLTGNFMAPDWWTPGWRQWCCLPCSQWPEALHGCPLLGVSIQCLTSLVLNILLLASFMTHVWLGENFTLSCRPLKAWISKNHPSTSQKSDISSKGLSSPLFLSFPQCNVASPHQAGRQNIGFVLMFIFINFFLETRSLINTEFCLLDELNWLSDFTEDQKDTGI